MLLEEELIKNLFEDHLGSDRSENYLTEQQCASSTNNKKKHSKRPSNNPVFMPALRILRRDIRRKYATMLRNVLNSHDPEFMKSFLQDFALPSIVVNHHLSDGCSLYLYRPEYLVGVDLVVNTFEINFSLMPDLILRILNCQICQALHQSGSKLIINTLLSGTLLYQFPTFSNSSGMKIDGAFSTSSSSLLEKLDTPLANLTEGRVIISLDPKHFISEVNVYILHSQITATAA